MRKYDAINFNSAADLWFEVGRVRQRKMKQVQEDIRFEQDKMKRELAAKFGEFLKQGVTRGAICTRVGISRPTLDKILDMYEVAEAQGVYFFERGFRRNVWLKGQLPDTGGYPGLVGEVAIRWADGVAGYVPVEGPLEDPGVKEFLLERYGAEVTAWDADNPLE